ncbi:glycine cleavage system protein T, partial [Mycobacterium hodleri]
SHMGEIDIIGPGAAAVLDYALVGTFTPVTVGRAKYSLLCDANGGILDDLIVYRLAEDHFLVVANAANTATVLREFISRSQGFDAAVVDRSSTTALIALQGPMAEGILSTVLSGADRPLMHELRYYAAIRVSIGSIPVLLARTGYTG